MLVSRPLVRFCMMRRLLATSMMTTMSGGATKPLSTAVQNSASIGLMPAKLMHMPTTVAAMMTP